MKNTLAKKLASLDHKYSSLGMPYTHRPNQAFKELYGSVQDGVKREKLFAPLVTWFQDKHGDKIEWDGTIGKIPILIEGMVYLLHVPFSPDARQIPLMNQIKNLPEHLISDFSAKHFEEIGRLASGMSGMFRNLYWLTTDDVFLNEAQRGLVWRSQCDLEISALALAKLDTQSSIFHSHAAAEKFLKVALQLAGDSCNPKSFGHGVQKIFERLSDLAPRYGSFKQSIEALQRYVPNMNIRYEVTSHSFEDATSCFYSALNICGTLANVWLFDAERGTSSSTFAQGKFYSDGCGNINYCHSIKANSAGEPCAHLEKMIDFPDGKSMLINCRIDMIFSCLYLEVKDHQEIQRLLTKRQRLQQFCKTSVSATDLGLVQKSDAEGIYLTGILKVRNKT